MSLRTPLVAVLLLVLAMAAVGAPSGAQAHDALVSTSPVDGEVIIAAPGEVEAIFSGAISLPPNALQIFAPDGSAVAIETPEVRDGATLSASLPPQLGPGTYTVAWRVVSSDGHPIEGAFVFSVGAPSTPAQLDPWTDPGAGWDFAAAAIRFAVYGASLLAAGLTVFVLLIHDRAGPERRRLQGVGAAFAGFAAIVLLPGMAVETVLLAGEGASALSDGEVWRFMFESHFGAAAATTMVSGAALALLLLRKGSVHWFALVPAAALIAALSINGHTRTADPGWLVLPSNLIHTAFAALWFGGLVGLVATLWWRKTAGPTPGPVVARFSTMALVSVVAVAVTGSIYGAVQLRDVSELWESRYGQVLGLKALVFMAVLGVAAWNNRRLVPRIRAGDRGAASTLLRTTAMEIGFLVLVVALTANLVNQPPPGGGHLGHGGGHASHQAPEIVGGTIGDLRYEIEVIDGQIGPNTVRVRLFNGDETPAEIVSGQVEFALPDREIPAIQRPLIDRGAGRFTTSVDVGLAGEWQVTLNIRATQFDEFRATVPIDFGE